MRLTPAPFLELEISLADKSTLKSRIEHMLLPERLDGANRYRCPKCDSLQPAIRSTHLKSLPPTLHFSLMRFVYDPYTESRKKSRAGISYPHLLELNGTNYALRGVVTHQGQSVSCSLPATPLTSRHCTDTSLHRSITKCQ